VQVNFGVFLNEFENGRQAVAEGVTRVVQPGESWTGNMTGNMTANDNDGERVVVNWTVSN
jgi:hypothetical protein